MGDKKYFFGEKLSETDCALFGHLAQFYYVNLSDFPMKNYLVGECPNLVSYIQRIREDIWPDWEEKCKADSMDNRMYWYLIWSSYQPNTYHIRPEKILCLCGSKLHSANWIFEIDILDDKLK